MCYNHIFTSCCFFLFFHFSSSSSKTDHADQTIRNLASSLVLPDTTQSSEMTPISQLLVNQLEADSFCLCFFPLRFKINLHNLRNLLLWTSPQILGLSSQNWCPKYSAEFKPQKLPSNIAATCQSILARQDVMSSNSHASWSAAWFCTNPWKANLGHYDKDSNSFHLIEGADIF